MSWRRIPNESRQVFGKEIRCLARDPHTVIYSVFLPLFLYPALTWTVLQVAIYLHGAEEAMISRVRVVGATSDGAFARDFKEASKEQKLALSWADDAHLSDAASESDRLQARAVILEGNWDAVLVVSSQGDGPEAAAGSVLEGRIYYGGARDSSTRARRRVKTSLETLRDTKLKGAAGSLLSDGESVEDFLDVLSREETDHSSAQELANYVASMALPLVMIIMTALGALYPALETTVGEKERATLETTLASPTSRFSLVVGKYGAVVVFSFLAFILNFGSMWFTLFHLKEQFEVTGLRLGLGAGAVILGAAALLALLLSAFMMLLGFLARSFREGQAFVTPVYLLAGIPAIFAASPDVALTPALACVPVVNVSLLFREALRGDLSALETCLTLGTSALYALVVLVAAARLLRREELALGGGLTLRQGLQALLGRKTVDLQGTRRGDEAPEGEREEKP